MEKIENVEDIAKSVADGTMTREAGAWSVLQVVSRCRRLFHLGYMEVDEVRDFLLEQFPFVLRVFDRYDPSQGSFMNYLRLNIQSRLSSWRRRSAQRFYGGEVMELDRGLAYEDAAYQYDKEEASLVCEDSAGQLSLEDVRNFTRTYRPIDYRYVRSRRPQGAENSFYSKKMDDLRKKACLVLALKSCYYVDDDMLDKVSCVTGIPFVRLKGMTLELRDTMRGKIARRETRLRNRDRHYYYRRAYAVAALRADRGSERLADLDRRRDQQTKDWQSSNRQLRDEGPQLAPKNTAVARVLGIKERSVSYIMRKAALHIDTISIPQYYGLNEDILGKRKYEQEAGGVGAVPGAYGGDARRRGD